MAPTPISDPEEIGKPGSDLSVLKEVNREDLPTLLTHLDQYLPDCLPVYGILETETDYDMRDYIERKVFIPKTNSDVASFVAVYPAGERSGYQHLAVFWDVECEDDSVVATLLGSIPDLVWAKPIFVQFSSTKIIDKLESLLRFPELGSGQQRVEHWYDGHLYLYNKDPPPVIVPTGFRLGPLKPEHTEYIMNNLPYEYETYKYSQAQIKKLPSSAVFEVSKNDDDSNSSNPICWVTTRGMGLSGKTFTLEEYRRRGLSTVAKKDLIRKKLAARQKVWAFLGDSFEASIRMHKAIGYDMSIRMCMAHIQ